MHARPLHSDLLDVCLPSHSIWFGPGKRVCWAAWSVVSKVVGSAMLLILPTGRPHRPTSGRRRQALAPMPMLKAKVRADQQLEALEPPWLVARRRQLPWPPPWLRVQQLERRWPPWTPRVRTR